MSIFTTQMNFSSHFTGIAATNQTTRPYSTLAVKSPALSSCKNKRTTFRHKAVLACASSRDADQKKTKPLYLPQVLHECEDTLIIDKPIGIPFHENEESQGIVQVVRRMQADGMLDYQGPLHPVHRLDRVTSGILVFAKSSNAAGSLIEEFRTRRVTKYYTALSGRKPNKKMGRVVGDMERSRRASWKLLRTSNRPAITRFATFPIATPVDTADDDKRGTDTKATTPSDLQLRMFLLKPETGRTHQLRVAMKSLGAPVLGDPTYSNAEEAKRHCRSYLHASAIRFCLGGNITQVVQPPTYGELFTCDEFQTKFSELFPDSMDEDYGMWFSEIPVVKSELPQQ
mmetsp:Transcript_25687/g.55794  ORF Transcript_25687/g.55794 Transcript_25687/m.55794 type:complete len:342 (-) Transcript_25687:94-1119(-)